MRRIASNYKSSNQRGFTLIELIIAFTVLAILSVVGVASFVDYSRSQTLLSDRQKLITVLNTAKANASSQLKNAYCPNNDIPALNQTLNGYSVTIDSATQYTLNIKCITTGTPPQQSEPSQTIYKLSNNITFDLTNPFHVDTIFFPLFTGKAVLTDTNDNPITAPATITLSGYGKTSKITIDQTGIIQ